MMVMDSPTTSMYEGPTVELKIGTIGVPIQMMRFLVDVLIAVKICLGPSTVFRRADNRRVEQSRERNSALSYNLV